VKKHRVSPRTISDPLKSALVAVESKVLCFGILLSCDRRVNSEYVKVNARRKVHQTPSVFPGLKNESVMEIFF